MSRRRPQRHERGGARRPTRRAREGVASQPEAPARENCESTPFAAAPSLAHHRVGVDGATPPSRPAPPALFILKSPKKYWTLGMGNTRQGSSPWSFTPTKTANPVNPRAEAKINPDPRAGRAPDILYTPVQYHRPARDLFPQGPGPGPKGAGFAAILGALMNPQEARLLEMLAEVRALPRTCSEPGRRRKPSWNGGMPCTSRRPMNARGFGKSLLGCDRLRNGHAERRMALFPPFSRNVEARKGVRNLS
jgi:hypothetical protein